MIAIPTKKFTREQLVFIVEAIYTALLDRVQSSLPSSIGLEDFRANEKEIRASFQPMIETASLAISVIYAQLTDDGMEILGPAESMQWQGFIGWLVDADIDRTIKLIPQLTPKVHFASSAFVDNVFHDYLTELAQDALQDTSE